MESAYLSENGNEVVIVFVNYLPVGKEIKFAGLPSDYKSIKIYRTSAASSENLSLIKTTDIYEVIDIPKRGIVTCVLTK